MGPASPLFIIGTERSGSNLLRLILNEHPSIAIPHPPHILKEMMPLEPLYGDLSIDRNFRRLVSDVARLVALHFAPWDVPVDEDAAFAQAPARGVYGVKAAIYDQYRRAKGKRRWGCKSTFVIQYVDLVLQHHPEAKLIHLVRDARDVAVSAKSSVFNHFHAHYVGKLWAEQQRMAAALVRKLPPKRIVTLRYEDLLDDPAKSVRRVCDFLGEDYSDSLLAYSQGAEARGLASQSRSWENLARPVLADNRAKYRKELSQEEIRAVERQAYAELERFGYALDNDPAALRDEARRGLSWPTRLRYWFSENARSILETARSLVHDKNAANLVKKKLFVWRLGVSRRLAPMKR